MTVKNNQWWNAQLGAAVARPGAPDQIRIRGIWLLYEGAESSLHRQAVVLVELPDGTLKRAIVEPLDGPCSHYVHPEGIRAAPGHLLRKEEAP